MTEVPEVSANPTKTNLLGLTQSKMEAFFESIGEKRFRAQQVLKWVHQLGVVDFEQMSNISKDLRHKLTQVAEIRFPTVEQQLDSVDGTRKFLIKVEGGSVIETVFIPDGERGTLCVSSQVGCSLDCSFCATGKQGFNRDLTAAEIIGQVWIAAQSFGQLQVAGPRRITNVVLMGMGEPLLAYRPVMESIALITDPAGLGFSPKRITVSTAGIAKMIRKLADDNPRVNLALSLHAPDDLKRNSIMPINEQNTLEVLMEALLYFYQKTQKIRLLYQSNIVL